MIETRDLVEYVKGSITNCDLHQEYIAEIVARLRAFDKLKESIENLLARLSNEGDKEVK